MEKEEIENCIEIQQVGEQIRLHRPTPDIYTEYKKSQMLVLCSRYEGFGLVLIEAMACGIPCISFDCPYGPPEIIRNHCNGLLAKDGDVRDLAGRMEWLMTHDEERRQMGINAHQYAARYKKEIVMNDWENAYDSLTDGSME